VPEPDISLHFLIQRVKVLNQVLKALIQSLEFLHLRLPVWQNFSSGITGLATFLDVRPKPQHGAEAAARACSSRAGGRDRAGRVPS
jgi:hypothetical protein